jgi:hypothetical protein
MSIKGYKVFNPDWTCRGFQYEVGKTFKHNGNIEICGSGFYFCQRASDCFNYYSFDSNNKVAEVEALGLVATENDKSVTDEIKIVREIPWSELLTIVNEGKDNSGFRNTGNCNTGNCNTGSRNTGDWNTGWCNTGNWNTGNWNTGNWNTGNWNTGNCNTGDWNTTSFNNGFFTTKNSPIYMFNKPTKYTSQREIRNLDGMQVLCWNYEDSWWVFSDNMTKEEKEEHPEYKTTGGYLKTVDFKTACEMMWNRLNAKDKELVMRLPNFDKDIFYEVTGIDVDREV